MHRNRAVEARSAPVHGARFCFGAKHDKECSKKHALM
jgi:hypothetical protein